jgi:hypothetical protein
MNAPTNAFEAWARERYADNVHALAGYLMACCYEGPRDSVAWDYLEATGDTAYTADTFIRAAELVLRGGALESGAE